ncbi:hypothetical protein [Tumebacillus permanentifrigoris]|uniref:Uncharacterized protein n=1 Tax=Tumebacillus permanentifrigoris TaxID=378543 RepID=A0A316D9V8_9BACL|nr:hypothetical protein [Tumebacillus permanentifrigoris]PWK14255.1 hypothetical protein C7459_1058 [Tumebacillus permanentifrigoris]
MRHYFEEWLDKIDVSESAKNIMNEAIVCYKASAYKSSLLFSYVGFQTIVRDRILYSQVPNGIQDGQWRDIHRKLRNDDIWDKYLFDLIQDKNSLIFSLAEDIQTQIRYWKDRRNDCAHGKNNLIDYSHVESFWHFIRSNLDRFVVSGSRKSILERIRTHFDVTLTAPGKECTFIHLIPRAVDEIELTSFLEEIHDILEELDGTYTLFTNKHYMDFWVSLFKLGDTKLNKSLVEMMKNNDDLLRVIIETRPESLLYFAIDPIFIRNLWYEKMYKSFSILSSSILSNLLRNSLIPFEEIDEAFVQYLHKSDDDIPNENELVILVDNGYFDVIKREVFQKKFPLLKFERLAKKLKRKIIQYIIKNKLDDVVVGALCKLIDANKEGYSELIEALRIFFEQNNEKRDEFLRVCNRSGFIPPFSINKK